jgi:D-alanyl-D-alanine carboxypeptidase/D-alanyl-D-alanine-endopeptidase (penicillin-binding protein 4)
MQPQGPGREFAEPASWGPGHPGDGPDPQGTPPQRAGQPWGPPPEVPDRRPAGDPRAQQPWPGGPPQQPGAPGWAGESAERARGPWATPPGSPAGSGEAGGGTYGRASVPLNTAPPTAAGPAESGPADQTQPVSGIGDGSRGGAGAAGVAPSPDAGASAWTSDGDRPVEAVPPGRARTKWVPVLSILVILVMIGGVLALVRPGPVKNLFSGSATASATGGLGPDPKPTPVLAGASGGGKELSPDAVKAALDPLVQSKALGTEVHVAVLDPANSQVLYAENADVPITPASTTKILTAVTALATRGPAYRISTRAVAGRSPGEVVLVGGGDPTLSIDGKSIYPGVARLDQLAAQVKKSLGGTRPTKVLIDTTLFEGPDTGLGWDGDVIPSGQVSRIQSLMVNGGRLKPTHTEGGDPRSSNPALSAGKAFAKLLGVPSSGVEHGTAAKSAKQLGVVQAPPLVQITDWMLQESDNTIAELVGRQVALAAGKPATFDDTSQAMLDKLKALGLPTDEYDLYDASGLSRHDGISPVLLTQTLALAATGKVPALSGLFDGLPVAGWSGTLANRFRTPTDNQFGEGVVRAKTGSLSGVNTMSGELVTKDGRLLVFAIMASGGASAAEAKQAIDQVPARLVACGC